MLKIGLIIFCLMIGFASNAQISRTSKTSNIDTLNISIDNFKNDISKAYLNNTTSNSLIIVLGDGKFKILNEKEFLRIEKEQIASMEVYTNRITDLKFKNLIILKVKK